MIKESLIIDNKYEVLVKIGEGGMSVVYLAHDRRLNKQWAIKEIKTTGNTQIDAINEANFAKEAKMMKHLDHPHLPRIVDIVHQDNKTYVVMDFIEGKSLSKILEEYGPQSQEVVIEWGLDLCKALDYLHTQDPPIIHRDLKPANVMLKPDGTVCIIDFGTAREYRRTSANEQSLKIDDTIIAGTKGYAAPEQFGGYGQTDARTDVYGLGVTLYHLLTGLNPALPPYEIYPIRQVKPTLSPGLEKVISKCVTANPELRYQSCAELYYALENFEKADDAYFGKLRFKKRLFISFLAATLIFGILGGAGVFANHVIVQNSYAGLLERAANAPAESREAYILEAIDLMPSDIKAYMDLISFYSEDGKLDSTEDDRLTFLLERNYLQIKKHTNYPQLAFEVGKLYWYYYDDNGFESSQLTRASRANKWFLDATTAKDEKLASQAKIYQQMTHFITEVYKSNTEDRDEGMYREYYENIRATLELLDSEPSRVVKLRAASMALFAVEVYADRFLEDGVSKRELLEICKIAQIELVKLDFNPNTSTEQYEQTAEALNRLPQALIAINDIYDRDAKTGKNSEDKQ